jgi:hypothetical protein
VPYVTHDSFLWLSASCVSVGKLYIRPTELAIVSPLAHRCPATHPLSGACGSWDSCGSNATVELIASPRRPGATHLLSSPNFDMTPAALPLSQPFSRTRRETTVFRSVTIAEPIRHAAHRRFADAGDLQSTPEGPCAIARHLPAFEKKNGDDEASPHFP